MRILFQGDSITDDGRSRERDSLVGVGYPLLVKAALGFEDPEGYEILNRGISGNRVADLYARINRDIISLAPDVLSILIGVNDVWGGLIDGDGADADKYYRIYDMLIAELKAALPDTKIMILEPFVLKGTYTESKWDEFRPGVEDRAAMAKKIADKYALTFVPLQAGFDELAERADAKCWLGDGVHPTTLGHEYIKNQWIEAFKKMK